MKKSVLQKDAYTYLVVAGILWAFAPLFYKNALATVGIALFLALRFLIGAVFIYAAERKKFKRIKAKLLYTIICFAIVDAVLLNAIYSYSVQRTSVLHISVILLLEPFLIYGAAALILKEKPHKVVITGGAIAVVGLAIIIVGSIQAQSTNHAQAFLGDLAMFTYAVVNALAIVVGRKLLSIKNAVPPEQFGFIEYATSTVAFFGIVLVTNSVHQINDIDIQAWLWIVAAGVVSGAVPIVLYLRSAKRLRAERLADISFITPAASGVIGVLFLGEKTTLSFLIGTVLIVVGILIGHKKIQPILAAHRVSADVRTLQQMFRVPQRAYEYISVESKNIIRSFNIK